MFVLANNLTLHYHIDGQPQGNPLVFINALGCDLRIWDALLTPFAGQFRIIRYDMRGHGLSDAPPGPYMIRDHTADLSALLTDLGVQNAVLIGISVGGLIAMDYALLYPERVSGLVLCDTAPKIGTSELWNDRIQAVGGRGLAEMAETILSRWFLPSFPLHRPADYNGYRNMLSRASQEGYIATCATLRDADLSSVIQTITAPTLALCGAGDVVVSPAQTRAWASFLLKAQVETIEDAAHLPCIEQPAAMTAVIGQFLREAYYAG